MTFCNRPAHTFVSGVDRVSRFSRAEFSCMLGVSDCAESLGCSHWRFRQCGLPPRWTTSVLRIHLFRSSISRLHVPLSTLRAQPCDWPRMTRGQGGLLRLPCMTLSFTTPRRQSRRTHPACGSAPGGSVRLSPRGPEVRFVFGHKGFAAQQEVSVSASPSSEPTKLSRSGLAGAMPS
jgi:hypothetical protein